MQVMAKKTQKSIPTTNEKTYLEILDLSIASMEYSEQLEKEGKVLHHGIAAGSSHSYWLMEVESLEEADLLLKGMPMFPFLDIEVIPLVSPKHVLDEIKSFVKKTKSKKKK